MIICCLLTKNHRRAHAAARAPPAALPADAPPAKVFAAAHCMGVHVQCLQTVICCYITWCRPFFCEAGRECGGYQVHRHGVADEGDGLTAELASFFNSAKLWLDLEKRIRFPANKFFDTIFYLRKIRRKNTVKGVFWGGVDPFCFV